MKNMGIRSLRIVGHFNPADHDSLLFAVSARDLLEQAVSFPTLEAALSDTTISIATTRRHGKYREDIMSPRATAALLLRRPETMRAAIVFGREDSGLTTSELSCCTHFATIPSTPECGSLNLAQSILIFCYELYTSLKDPDHQPEQREQASSEEMESLFSHMRDNLLRIGFLNPQNPEHIMRTLRRVYFRAALNSREVSILRGILSQSDWAAASFDGRK